MLPPGAETRGVLRRVAEAQSRRDPSVGDVRVRVVPLRIHGPGRAPTRRRMKILDRLPIPKDRTSLRFGGRYVTIRADQIPVWVSIHLSGVLVPEENIPKFPALLDTGNNFGFS